MVVNRNSCGYTDDGNDDDDDDDDGSGGSGCLVLARGNRANGSTVRRACTIDFGYLCRDIAVQLILRVLACLITTALLNVQRRRHDFLSRRWRSQARRRCKPRNNKSLRRADNSILANWRHKEVQLPTKRALFFVLHLFLLLAEIRPGTPEIPPPMVCMQTPTARGRRTCSREKSSGSADGSQSDLFQARMVTPMQIALTRLKARYWHWVSSVSEPVGQSRCQ
ncbi:Uncharacterized protein DBV15_02219, partial [Temnothorax longispinosus]